jgi:hypothetical protein
MTDQPARDLVPLAKGWLQPPRLAPKRGEARYEPAERAYHLHKTGDDPVEATLLADAEHPVVGFALVLNGLRLDHPQVAIDGVTLAAGKDFHHGTTRGLNEWKTIIWLDREFSRNTGIRINP